MTTHTLALAASLAQSGHAELESGNIAAARALWDEMDVLAANRHDTDRGRIGSMMGPLAIAIRETAAAQPVPTVTTWSVHYITEAYGDVKVARVDLADGYGFDTAVRNFHAALSRMGVKVHSVHGWGTVHGTEHRAITAEEFA